jgi:hypothetical protein
MNTPEILLNELKRAELHLGDDGELPAIHRKEIHELIQNLSINNHKDAGYYVRAKLAITCACSCINKLDTYASVKEVADELLKKAVLALQSKFDMKELETLNGRLHTSANNLIDQDAPDFKAVYAAFACVAAVNTVLYDVDFDQLGLSEVESAPDDWDASFYASLSHCGGATWEDVGDSIERKKFWLWYLNKAVPHAWTTTTPLGCNQLDY